MANDRMYLYNTETRQRVFIAKHFGDVWETREHAGVGAMAARLDAAFLDAGTSKAWKIVYETDDDFDTSGEYMGNPVPEGGS